MQTHFDYCLNVHAVYTCIDIFRPRSVLGLMICTNGCLIIYSNNDPWALIRDVRLFIQIAFRVGAYSRRALIQDLR